jgi:hypothetical protein
MEVGDVFSSGKDFAKGKPSRVIEDPTIRFMEHKVLGRWSVGLASFVF